MAKIINPLFADFYEAFGTTIVFQRRFGTDVIARKKVRHAEDPTSAHVKSRASRWAKAVHCYQNDNPENETLIECVSRYALSPNAPKNLMLQSINENTENPLLFDVTLSWDAVTHKYGGHPLANMLGYFVNISFDGLHWQRLNETPIAATAFTDVRPQGTVYYTIQAIDDQNNLSSESELLEVAVQPI